MMLDGKPELDDLAESLKKVRAELSRVMVGQEEVIEFAIVALVCEGHVLFEGVPGIGKTLLAKSLARAFGLDFSRIQFTPDLLPADVLGTDIITQSSSGVDLRFEAGPVFSNIVLADEINRASPKTQSALLEAMQERMVTLRGQSRPLPRPFMVLATQNPIEMEGTYPLPEAQVDRFLFKILMGQPDRGDLLEILERTLGPVLPEARPVLAPDELPALQEAAKEIVVPGIVLDRAARIVLATQPGRADSPELVRRHVRYGAGPRGAQALVMAAKARALLEGRPNASLEDLERCLLPALRHRVALNYEGLGEGLCPDDLVSEAFAWAAQGRDAAGKAAARLAGTVMDGSGDTRGEASAQGKRGR
jgi:MoxR-like ATPase